MVGFEYKYNTLKEILNNIKLLSDFGLIELIIMALGIIFIFILLYYILPTFNIMINYRKDQKEKAGKKKLMKQILMQKEIEDEIAKEVEKYDLKKPN